MCIYSIYTYIHMIYTPEVTEREEFSVPIRASGGTALLDFPDAA